MFSLVNQQRCDQITVCFIVMGCMAFSCFHDGHFNLTQLLLCLLDKTVVLYYL
jgi:hypothetical protein